MINTDRIVPVMVTDLISLYAVMVSLAGVTATAAEAEDPGVFKFTAGGTLLAAEPVKTADFGEDVAAATLYFVPAYDYAGFTAAGEPIETTGDAVEPDGCSLYKAELSGGSVTISKIGA